MADAIHHTTCTMDCPDTCALDVHTRHGRIIKITGNPGNSVTNGFICAKVRDFAKRVYHPDRLKFPLKRSGKKGSGDFVRISWKQAVAEIAQKFTEVKEKYGAEAILPYHYGGSNGMIGDGFVDDLFFARLGASRISKTLCAVPTTLVASGMYGKMPGIAFEDYRYARFILIWGANPKASNIHLVPFIREAKRNGAFVAVVDPVNNFSAREIDLHLAVRPGCDLPLALAMINFWREKGMLDSEFMHQNCKNPEPLFKQAAGWSIAKAASEAGIEPSQLELLAETYAHSSPAVLRCGWGLERNRNGGQAVAAIFAMPALLGKFGVRGGGYTMSNSGALKFDTAKILGHFKWQSRQLNMTQLGEILTSDLHPPVKAMYVYNCNPAATVPDQQKVLQGLQREDLFTVVHEQVMTDTALYADIILPAVTFTEQTELKKSYGNYLFGKVNKVIEPIGESKPNEEVFRLLAKSLGMQDEAFNKSAGQLQQELLAQVLPKLKSKNNVFYEIEFEDQKPVQFGNVFPATADEKIDLCPAVLGDSPYEFITEREKEFPLQLISPASPKLISSTFGEFNYPKLTAILNPQDAETRQIKTGQRVKIFNQRGTVECLVEIKNSVRPGVIVLPKGAWRKASLNGNTATTLCPANVQVVGGGSCFNDTWVEISGL